MAIPKKPMSTQKAVKKTSLLYQDKSTKGNKARWVPWNKGLVKMDIEVPIELYERINALAKRAGMSFERFSSILLTQYVMDRKREKVDEKAAAAVLQVIAGVYPDDYQRIEEELSSLPSSAEKLQRLLLELSPGFERRFRENEMN